MIPDIVFVHHPGAGSGCIGGRYVFSKNAIYSALNLILNFSSVAVLYLILGAPFIALAQVTVYAGAIMVFFLFVIMLLGAERLRQSQTLPYQQPVSIILAAILAVVAIYALLFRPLGIEAASSRPGSSRCRR